MMPHTAMKTACGNHDDEEPANKKFRSGSISEQKQTFNDSRKGQQIESRAIHSSSVHQSSSSQSIVSVQSSGISGSSQSCNEPSIHMHDIVRMEGDIPDIPLPPGWIGVNHASGGIIYTHTETRVVTWSRPYALKPCESLRKHSAPTLAIPCLHQLKALLKKQAGSAKGTESTSSSDVAKQDVSKSDPADFDYISPEILHKYLARIFRFDKLSSSEQHMPRFFGQDFNVSAAESRRARIGLKANRSPNARGSKPKDDLFGDKLSQQLKMVAGSKNAKGILHELCMQKFKAAPEYRSIQRASTNDFAFRVVVNGVSYGMGQARAKKLAQNIAAERTLEMLVPQTYNQLKGFEFDRHILETFDAIEITDANLYPLTCKLGLHPPSVILAKAMQRNLGLFKNQKIVYNATICEDRISVDYEMTVGDHHVTGRASSKKNAKQIASQFMIKKIHPEFDFWGSIIRLYDDQLPDTLFKETKLARDDDLERMGMYDTLNTANEVLVENIKREIKRMAPTLDDERERWRSGGDPFMALVGRNVIKNDDSDVQILPFDIDRPPEQGADQEPATQPDQVPDVELKIGPDVESKIGPDVESKIGPDVNTVPVSEIIPDLNLRHEPGQDRSCVQSDVTSVDAHQQKDVSKMPENGSL